MFFCGSLLFFLWLHLASPAHLHSLLSLLLVRPFLARYSVVPPFQLTCRLSVQGDQEACLGDLIPWQVSSLFASFVQAFMSPPSRTAVWPRMCWLMDAC